MVAKKQQTDDQAPSAPDPAEEEAQASVQHDEVMAEKAEAEAQRADPVAEAAQAKERDPNAPSTAQVPDSSASMVRPPDEGGEPPPAAVDAGVTETAVPGQPPGAVYPDRTA